MITASRHPVRRLSARARLTLFYGVLFVVFGVLLVGLIMTVVFAARPRVAVRLPGDGDGTRILIRSEQLASMQEHARQALDERLLIGSGLAIGVMTIIGLGASWVMAGRVLARMQRAFTAQQLFTANASHELRGPIATQRALVDVTLAKPELSPDARELAGSLRDVLRRQERLVAGLFELASSQHGVRQRDTLRLDEVVREVLDRWRPQLDGLEVHEDLAPATTNGDPVLIDILVDNLIRNAITHNLPGGWLRVRTGAHTISVHNSGPVVPRERLADLTAPFRRGARDRTGNTAGSGLGLAIVDTVATAHRASLRLVAPESGGIEATVVFR